VESGRGWEVIYRCGACELPLPGTNVTTARSGLTGRVVAAVSAEWDVDAELIYGGDRHSRTSHARAVCLLVIQRLAKCGDGGAAQALGMNRTSARAAIRKLQGEIEADPGLCHRVESVRRRVSAGAVSRLSELSDELAEVDAQIRTLLARRTILNEQIDGLVSAEAAE
jgi:hypothetical protein